MTMPSDRSLSSAKTHAVDPATRAAPAGNVVGVLSSTPK
jgi:hypothetical protein